MAYVATFFYSESSRKLSAAFFYGFTSSAMAFLNKALLTSNEFKYPFTVLAVQMAVGLVAVEILRATRSVKLAAFTLSTGRKMCWPSVCCAVHSVLSLLALDGMNLPMYAAIKRCTPLVNLVLAGALLGKPPPSNTVVFSILLITVGCLIAGIGDLSFHKTAYLFGISSVLIQGMYQTLIQKTAENDFSTLEIFYINCYNCFLFFLMGSILTFELKSISSFPHLTSPKFIACFLLVTGIGAVLNYSLFLCTSLNSALTTSLIGVLKSIIQTVLGSFTFGGIIYHPLIVIGLILNTSGGILYTVGKFKESKPKNEYINGKTKCIQAT